jgi:disulfide bond formation protein DsbB
MTQSDSSHLPNADIGERALPYIVLGVALIATIGSLTFSEVFGWIPCMLCWYQRILMYPLVIITGMSIVRKDIAGIPLLVLPFSVPGALLALYHYLLIKTDWFPPPPCNTGVPCTVDYIDLYGFINIPFMSLTAFVLISATCWVIYQTTAVEADPA